LIGILKNKVTDHYRKSGSRTGREKELTDLELYSDSNDNDFISSGSKIGTWNPEKRPQAWSLDSSDPVEKEQFWKQLFSCLDGIDQRLAMVYRLRDVQEMEYKEVCNVLDVSSTNLRVMLYRARKLLRQCLETHWVGE
jgi:RNA polymerase sigma-70 factor (ECF subfamily)